MATLKPEVKSLLYSSKDNSLRIDLQPKPTPSKTQYLIHVQAVGITKGELKWPEPNSLSMHIPGFDVAGTVVTAPSDESKFQPGDKVYGLTAFDRTANARELTLIEESEIAQMPENLSFVEAAAVPMSALTAREALFEKGGLKYEAASTDNKNATLLVVGASGAVGIWAIQLAKWAGVGHVVGICGTSNVEFVKSLGADDTIDYRKTNINDWASSHVGSSKFDLVLDGVGGQAVTEAWTLVKENGQLISIVQPVDELKPQDGVSDGAKGSFFIVRPDGKPLKEITELLEQKVLKPAVDNTYPLGDFKAAFERVEGGHAKGKVILQIAE